MIKYKNETKRLKSLNPKDEKGIIDPIISSEIKMKQMKEELIEANKENNKLRVNVLIVQ